VRRVADAQQPGDVPADEPVQPDVEVLDVLHRGQRADALPELGHEFGDVLPEALDAPGAQLRIGSLPPDVGDLEEVGARDHDGEPPLGRPGGQRVGTVPGQAWKPEPPGVDRHGEFPQRQIRLRVGDRPAAVTGHGELGTDRTGGPVLRSVPHPPYPSGFADQFGCLGAHPQREGRFLARGLREQVQQVPLGHQRDVRMPHAQPAEVRDDDAVAGADREEDFLHPAVRQRGEPLSETQLVEQFQRRGVDGVAAEVAQEVRMLLQHRDLSARSGEQEPQHHAGGSATDDHAGRALVHRCPLICRVAGSARRCEQGLPEVVEGRLADAQHVVVGDPDGVPDPRGGSRLRPSVQDVDGSVRARADARRAGRGPRKGSQVSRVPQPVRAPTARAAPRRRPVRNREAPACPRS
jgi:hypothetical protein